MLQTKYYSYIPVFLLYQNRSVSNKPIVFTVYTFKHRVVVVSSIHVQTLCNSLFLLQDDDDDDNQSSYGTTTRQSYIDEDYMDFRATNDDGSVGYNYLDPNFCPAT